jgi:copper homeostasis protein
MEAMKPVLEIIAVSAADARAAEAGGADRIELVAAMSEGGLTPSYGLIERTVHSVSIPVYVMIRPHSRSFRYDDDEIRLMRRDIRVAAELGASGIVLGALTESGELEEAALSEWLGEARERGLDVTFHRAFDECADQPRMLRRLAAFPGVSRVLTSGGKRTAPEGSDALAKLARIGRELGISVMAGSGLRPDGLDSFVRDTGIVEVHLGSGARRNDSFLEPVDPLRVAEAKRRLRLAAEILQSRP